MLLAITVRFTLVLMRFIKENESRKPVVTSASIKESSALLYILLLKGLREERVESFFFQEAVGAGCACAFFFEKTSSDKV